MSNNIEHIFYINLEKRSDRKDEIEAECKKMDLQCERIEGIYYWIGGVGCGISHINALKTAKQRGYKNVLILEDDFEFLVEKDDFELYMEQLFQNNADFDVCFLSYNLDHYEHIDGNSYFFKIYKTFTFSGYIVNEKMYDNLIDMHSYAIDMFARTNLHWIYSIDQQAWNQVVPLYNIIGCNKRIGKQRAGYSDNSLQVVDYQC